MSSRIIRVTSAEVMAAKLNIKLVQQRGGTVDEAIHAIANARPERSRHPAEDEPAESAR